MSLLVEALRWPAFPEREVERLKDERLAELLELKSEPRGLADERFASALYRDSSRLSLPEGGSEHTVAGITSDGCRAWHSSRFAPATLTVVIVGDVAAGEAESLCNRLLGDWVATAPAPQVVDDAPAITTPRIRIVNRPNAPQTEIRLGHVGLRRDHPDYFSIVVMNAILGGVFNSRINLNLRERNAFTYGAFSAFEWRRDAGPFVVSTAVATAVTVPAVQEIIAEIDGMRAAPPAGDELSLAVSYLDGVFPIRFETTDAIAGALASLKTLRLPDDYYDTYRDRIRSVTAETVLAAAQKHLRRDALQLVAVGDAAQIADGLAGLALGPLEVVDGTGDA
jgi:zinc protease